MTRPPKTAASMWCSHPTVRQSSGLSAVRSSRTALRSYPLFLQGRGIVCGGSFTLTYDQSLSVQVEPAGGCQINAEPGKIRASFASATPVADQVSLLKLTIQNAVPGAIDLSNAIFRDDSGNRIAAADVRPTTLSYTTSAAAFAGTLRADTSAGQTQYLLDVDVSDMRAGTPEARTGSTCWRCMTATV